MNSATSLVHTHTAADVHIAVLDDEPDITRMLAGYLTPYGFRVSETHSGDALLALMRTDPPALVLLDLGLPGEDGFAIARQLREHWHCGLVILSGRGAAVDKIVGLEVGADDYVVKPFDPRELLARVKAVLRRIGGGPREARPGGPARQCFAGYTVDLAARSLTDADGHDVVLTAGEFDLLAAFMRHQGRVLSRDFLLSEIRGREAGPFDRAIDVQVGRLRKKIRDPVDNPQIIKSIRSAGYIFVSAVTPG